MQMSHIIWLINVLMHRYEARQPFDGTACNAVIRMRQTANCIYMCVCVTSRKMYIYMCARDLFCLIHGHSCTASFMVILAHSCEWFSLSIYGWVMSHKWMRQYIWMSHITQMNLLYNSHDASGCNRIWLLYEWDSTYGWGMSHIWMSHVWMRHVTRMNEACHTYEWGMSHVWMRHVTRMMAPYVWLRMQVSLHVCMSHDTRVTYLWVMSHLWRDS